MARIGYARVSSMGQNLDRQIELLEKAGATKIFKEKQSGAEIKNRPELLNLLDYIREKDIVIVAELDRLGRNTKDLDYIINTIQNKGASLQILNLPTTKTEDPALNKLLNNLVLELYKYIAETERQKIRERQKQGIALAKKQGKYKGRKKKYTKDSPQIVHAFKLLDQGYSIRKASESTGINYQTLRNYIQEYRN
ncbi:MAG: recombinase family protein [Anaerococcus vaginalis]|uniref:recombinase family protein n=1 Tax=Anaerococcus vaginalis TaxID=33037 RepID=UPI0029100B64|nr:recombinase family protein [Anaerococcus vaginalis]MDU5087174.1 recombinase family protein [Anaerococcus vaginalis]